MSLNAHLIEHLFDFLTFNVCPSQKHFVYGLAVAFSRMGKHNTEHRPTVADIVCMEWPSEVPICISLAERNRFLVCDIVA